MRLYEMFDKAPKGYQELENDHSVPKWKESRKTKLTLRQIRKLRKMIDIRNYEKHQHIKKVREQYGSQQQGSGPSL